VVGSGVRVSFWQDVWCGDIPLSLAFPVVYSLALNKEATVAEYVEVNDGIVAWNVSFVRSANDWELEEFSAFFSKLYGTAIRRGEDDKMAWTGSKNGSFTVRSMYSSVVSRSRANFPWKGIWKTKCPLKVSFFVWEATHGKILTSDNLRRKDIYIADWCYLCRDNGESVDHVLLHCPFSRGIWNHVLGITNFQWVMPEKVSGVLWSWSRRLSNPIAKAIWRMIPSCIWWCLWRERNSRCFENCSLSLVKMQELVLLSLFSWANVVLGCPFVDFNDFLSFLVCLD
jgi:mannosylglycoprotein endo-beta-mannosidase